MTERRSSCENRQCASSVKMRSFIFAAFVALALAVVHAEDTEMGPTEFYDGKNFLMSVTKGIVILVFKNEGPTKAPDALAEITLDGAADSVKGSMINSSSFSVTLDWKASNFGTGTMKITSILLKFTFDKKSYGKEYALTGLEATKVVIDKKNILDSKIKVQSSEGYRVSAPIGTAFACDVAGIFPPKEGGEGDKSNAYRIGMAFPDMQLQVFDVDTKKFGPSWYCAELFSIGLWVGIIMTLIFAFVCWWGFSMLANINTNDKFDDPKGKPLQVPQNE